MSATTRKIPVEQHLQRKPAGFTLHPDTIAKLKEMAARELTGMGQIIDRLVREAK
jgi:hypothetical protein